MRSRVVMNRDYWERLARDYEGEVFSVVDHDREALVRRRLEACASKQKHVLDLGCGIGLWLPMLAGLFGSVTAVDLAAGLLRQARQRAKDLVNVRFRRADVAHRAVRLPKADVVLCVNAVLMPELASQLAMFRAMGRCLGLGGQLVLVTPSLESALLTKRRLMEWNQASGMGPGTAAKSALAEVGKSAIDWLCGVVRVDGVPTKHFLKEELEMVLRADGFACEEVVKLEYPWKTEFEEPPDWMRAPYPWDWLVVATKRKK